LHTGYEPILLLGIRARAFGLMKWTFACPFPVFARRMPLKPLDLDPMRGVCLDCRANLHPKYEAKILVRQVKWKSLGEFAIPLFLCSELEA
jgi:hypothetical protein